MSRKTLFAFALVGSATALAQPVMAADQSPAHDGNWPIQNGVNRQPTGDDKAISPDQAREVDRLYDQLLSTGDKSQPRHKRAR